MKYSILLTLFLGINLYADELVPIYPDTLYTKKHLEVIKHFDTTYKVSGVYTPKWMTYASNKSDYKSGFHEALQLCLTQLPLMGTDTILLNKLKAIQSKSSSYQNGFFAGLETYSAYADPNS